MAEAPDDLLAAFADIAIILAGSTFDDTLRKVVSFAVETVDGCDHAGVSVIEGRSIRTHAPTDDVPERVDAIQYDVGQGPCLDAIREHHVFESGDLRDEARWPDFSARAVAETGVLSMVAFRLFIEADTMGALNMYSMAANAFSEDSHAVGAVLAAHAAVAMQSARRQEHVEQLEQALISRAMIGQAVGMLMASRRIDSEEGFDLLRGASQRLNVKLRDVAQRVVDVGALPPERRR